MNSSLAEFMSFASDTHLIVSVIAVLAVLCIIAFKPLNVKDSNTFWWSLILCIIILCRIALQPIGWGTGGDRENYAYRLILSSDNILEAMSEQPDPLFTLLSQMIYSFTDLDGYFWAIAFIYISLYWWASKRLSKGRIFWMLLAVTMSFGFIAYGTNTLRAGLAIALLLLGITYYDKKVPLAVCLALSLSLHMSMIIPISMFLVSKFFPKTRLFFILWIISIPVSFLAGDFFNTLFASFSDDSRTHYLMDDSETYKVGFRIDFILYSLLPLAIGYYYIFKRGFRSALYRNIYNTYVLTNIFWILVIRANFSDRFAYLSWFLIPVILAYPILRRPDVVRAPNAWLASIIAGETLFAIFV